MIIAGLFWSRIVGPVVGLALFFLMYRWGGGARGLMLGAAGFIAACWWGERFWLAQEADESLRIEDRGRDHREET